MSQPRRTIVVCCILSAAVATFPAVAADKLYRREVSQKNPGGRDFVMTFEEVQRGDKASTVKVKFVSGASVPTIMFIVRGCYDMARERKAGYFINLRKWKDDAGHWMYRVGFTNDKNVDPSKYFILPFTRDKV